MEGQSGCITQTWQSWFAYIGIRQRTSWAVSALEWYSHQKTMSITYTKQHNHSLEERVTTQMCEQRLVSGIFTHVWHLDTSLCPHRAQVCIHATPCVCMCNAEICTHICTRTYTNRTGGKPYFSEKDKSHMISFTCGNKNESENGDNSEQLNSDTEHRLVVPEAGQWVDKVHEGGPKVQTSGYEISKFSGWTVQHGDCSERYHIVLEMQQHSHPDWEAGKPLEQILLKRRCVHGNTLMKEARRGESSGVCIPHSRPPPVSLQLQRMNGANCWREQRQWSPCALPGRRSSCEAVVTWDMHVRHEPLLSPYVREVKTYNHENDMYQNAHRSSIQSNRKLETAHVSITRYC